MNPRSTILPCPNCRQRLRVPTDRGGLILTCPTCRTRWDWSPTQEGGPGRQAPDASPPVTAAQAERTDADDRVGLDPRKLSDFMVREAVITDLQATTKEGAIREIVCSLKDAGYLAEADTESIIRAILAREELGSTGIGGGMACPETRHPAVNRVIGTIGRSRQGIEFDACDGEPVDLLFLVITPGNRAGDHQRAMESIVRLTREPVVSLLRQAQTREEVGDLLVEADRMASVFPLLEAEQRNEFPRLEADQMIAVFPSENEMGQLPLRALVAFAVRCARRVQPLFTLPDDHPEKQKHIAAVERASRTAEAFAQGIPEADRDAAWAAARAAWAASMTSDAAGLPPNAAWAAAAASDAAHAAFHSSVAAPVAAAQAAWDAAVDSVRTAEAAARAYNAWPAAAARSDYDRLRELGLGCFPDLGEPIDPSVTGPLGPLWRD